MGDAVIAAQRYVYPCASGDAMPYPVDCPFLAPDKRCVPTSASELSRFSCWDSLPPGRIDSACVRDASHKTSAWSSERFASAFASRSILYFIGASLSDQMWRSLLCLERDNLTPGSTRSMTHFSKPSSLTDVANGRLRCAELLHGARLCHTR